MFTLCVFMSSVGGMELHGLCSSSNFAILSIGNGVFQKCFTPIHTAVSFCVDREHALVG